MTYQESSDLFRDPAQRGRMEMCTREQGLIYANDGRADIAALGVGVTACNGLDIDAVIAAVCATPGADTSTDGGLLSAVQTVWPAVAAARYPQSA